MRGIRPSTLQRRCPECHRRGADDQRRAVSIITALLLTANRFVEFHHDDLGIAIEAW